MANHTKPVLLLLSRLLYQIGTALCQSLIFKSHSMSASRIDCFVVGRRGQICIQLLIDHIFVYLFNLHNQMVILSGQQVKIQKQQENKIHNRQPRLNKPNQITITISRVLTNNPAPMLRNLSMSSGSRERLIYSNLILLGNDVPKIRHQNRKSWVLYEGIP